MKYWKLPVAAALFFGLVAVFIICGCGIIADKLTFLPRNDTYPGLKDVSTADLETGGRIALRYLPPARPDGTVFLHCHGNSESLGTIAWRQELFNRHGYGILAFDYEGYGRSTGKASEEALERDVLRAWKYLTETLEVPPRRIVIHGYSLGTGAACFLASRIREAKALVLEAPFTSVYAVAGLGWMPGNRFPSDRRIGKVPFPVMIVHGSGDTVIPVAHGEKLYTLVRSPGKRFFKVQGAGHNDIIGVAGAEYWRNLADFLDPKGRK